MNKVILFGAGKNGIIAAKKYGDYVAFFCDNNKDYHGTYINNIEVISFEKMTELYRTMEYTIVITPAVYASMQMQLEAVGINDYIVFEQLVSNIFEDTAEKLNNIENIEHNTFLDKLEEESSKLDLPLNVKGFKSIVEKAMRYYKENNKFLARICFNHEGNYYGNTYNLLRYADIDRNEAQFFPQVSHFIALPMNSMSTIYKHAVVFQDNTYKSKIHKYYPYVPVFNVGPYINYAVPNISQKDIQKIKKENGKTLLAFLPHSIENSATKPNKEVFIDNIIRQYTNDFDTILLCVYWADILDPICDYAEEKGIKTVTTGFRFDYRFNDRLRTLFDVSDAIVCGDIGSFITYSISLGKPLARVDYLDEKKEYENFMKNREEESAYIQYMQDLKNSITDDFDDFDKRLKWYNRTSGYSPMRSPEYIRNIHEISFDIWKHCEGILDYYPEAVRAVSRQYYRFDDMEKYLVLKGSIGRF